MRILSLSILFWVGTVYSQTFSSGNIESYLNKTYRCGGLGWEIELKLNNDYTYESSEDSEGSWYFNSGSFEFKEGYLFLKPNVCKASKISDVKVPCNETLGEAKIEVIVVKDDLFFLEYLRLTAANSNSFLKTDDLRIGVTGKEVPEGTPRTFNNRKVVTMGMKRGITTSDVKIRKGPDINSEVIMFQEQMFTEELLRAVPIDYPVRVIARTEDKVSVQKWTNYWYLVNVGFHEQVWMYGEFVKFD